MTDTPSPWADLFDGLDEGTPEPISSGPQPGDFQLNEVVYQDDHADDPPVEVDQRFVEVERRMSKAILYRQFLSGRIFDDPTPVAREVEAEFREFSNARLSELLGVPSDSKEDRLDQAEIAVLKKIAATVMNSAKYSGVVATKPPVAPPAPAKPPTLRKIPAAIPKVEVPQAPPIPIKKPVGRPPKPVAKPAGTTPNKVPPNGEKFKQGTKTYEIVWKEVATDEFGDATSPLLERLGRGQTLQLPNGVNIFRDLDSTLYKIIRKDISRAVDNKARQPKPTGKMLERATEMMAAQTLANSARNNSGVTKMASIVASGD